MSEAPERIWAWPGSYGWFYGSWFSHDTHQPEAVSYTRSDLCDRDAIRAEAFEEAARICDELSRISDGVLAATGNGGRTNFIGDAHRACSTAIRAKAEK